MVGLEKILISRNVYKFKNFQAIRILFMKQTYEKCHHKGSYAWVCTLQWSPQFFILYGDPSFKFACLSLVRMRTTDWTLFSYRPSTSHPSDFHRLPWLLFSCLNNDVQNQHLRNQSIVTNVTNFIVRLDFQVMGEVQTPPMKIYVAIYT